MGTGNSYDGGKAAVGDDMTALLLPGQWYKHGHLLKLNLCILLLTLLCTYNFIASY